MMEVGGFLVDVEAVFDGNAPRRRPGRHGLFYGVRPEEHGLVRDLERVEIKYAGCGFLRAERARRRATKRTVPNQPTPRRLRRGARCHIVLPGLPRVVEQGELRLPRLRFFVRPVHFRPGVDAGHE